MIYLLPRCKVNGKAPVWSEWMVSARSTIWMKMSSCRLICVGEFSVPGSILFVVLLLRCAPKPCAWGIVPPDVASSCAPSAFCLSQENAC